MSGACATALAQFTCFCPPAAITLSRKCGSTASHFRDCSLHQLQALVAFTGRIGDDRDMTELAARPGRLPIIVQYAVAQLPGRIRRPPVFYLQFNDFRYCR